MVSIEVGWLRDVTVPYPAKSPNPALLSAEATGQNAKAHTYLEGPILEAHIGTLHSPAVSHLLSDTTFPQLGILRVPLFVPVLAGFLLRTTQVRSAPVSNWQPLISPEVPCPRRPPAKSACLEGPILEAPYWHVPFRNRIPLIDPFLTGL